MASVQLSCTAVDYRTGYKFQTAHRVSIYVGIFPENTIRTPFLYLNVDGWLSIDPGYAWDGMTGAIDTKNSILGSLVHDALYQLMRRGHLPLPHRPTVDLVFYQILLAKGMWRWRPRWIYRAVCLLAEFAAEPQSVKPILTA